MSASCILWGASTDIPVDISVDPRPILGRYSTECLSSIDRCSDPYSIILLYYIGGSLILHRYFTDTSPILHRYFTDTSPILHRYFTDTSPILHRYFTDTSPILHRYFTDTSPILHRYFDYTSADASCQLISASVDTSADT